MSLLYGVDDAIAIKGTERTEVDDLTADVVVSLKYFSGLKGVTNHLSVGSNGNIRASSLNLGLTNWKDEVHIHDLIIDFELNSIHHFVFEENNGVVVSDCSLEKTSAILDAPRTDYLESWYLRVPSAEALGVLSANACADTINSAENNWAS